MSEALPVTDGNGQVTQQIKNKNKKESKTILDNSSREAETQLKTYLKPEYYSLLQVIADRYNDRFLYPYNYTLTHHQKMKFGEF